MISNQISTKKERKQMTGTSLNIPTPLGSQMDLTGGNVEITLSADKRKLWINQDGICRLRANEANITIETRDGNEEKDQLIASLAIYVSGDDTILDRDSFLT